MIRKIKLLITRYFLFVIFTTLALSCGKESETPEPKKPVVVTKDLTIDPATTYQTIAGFGGASWMWGTQNTPTTADMQKAFGMDEGELGFSIFRIRLASNPNDWPAFVEASQEALKYGAKILASPWSPPAALKSNGSDVGGHLPEENYQAFVDHINVFVEYMAANDVEIYAISIQNEPDIQVSYESCDWTAPAMRDFIKEYGHLIEGTKIAAPESFNFNQSYTNTLLNDDEAAEQIDIVAGHIYGSGLGRFPLAEEKGKEIWMTEYLMNQGATSQWSELPDAVIWEETLDMLETIHESMTNNWNAYIWWYLKRYYSFLGDGTQGTTSGEILKRGYAFSHFSRFIRPGYVRIGVELENPDIMVSAYQGNGKTVVVMINPTENPVGNVSLAIDGVVPQAATVYSTTLLMDRRATEIEVEDGLLLTNILAKSVTTVVIEE